MQGQSDRETEGRRDGETEGLREMKVCFSLRLSLSLPHLSVSPSVSPSLCLSVPLSLRLF